MRARRTGLAAAAAFLVLALVGCASSRPTGGDSIVPPVAPTDASTGPEGALEPPAAPGAEAATSAPSPGVQGRTYEAKQLANLERDNLTQALGSADFSRRDGPAEMLQYKVGTCTLNIFLYRERIEGPMRVLHVEARNPRMETMSSDECLTDLLRSRRRSIG